MNSIRKTLENRTNMEDDRISVLETQLAQARLIAEESDKKYEEVSVRWWVTGLQFSGKISYPFQSAISHSISSITPFNIPFDKLLEFWLIMRPLTSASTHVVCERCSSIGASPMRSVWTDSSRSSRRPEWWLRTPTANTMRSDNCWSFTSIAPIAWPVLVLTHIHFHFPFTFYLQIIVSNLNYFYILWISFVWFCLI